MKNNKKDKTKKEQQKVIEMFKKRKGFKLISVEKVK